MKKYRFYKEDDNRWYIDLPEWTGSKSELEMVAGADTMLDYFAADKKEVWMYVSENEIKDGYTLEFIRYATEINNGALYKFYNYQEHIHSVTLFEVWLCDVTKFVFGYFPKSIYMKKCYNTENHLINE